MPGLGLTLLLQAAGTWGGWAQRRAVLPGSAVLLEKGVSEEVGALWAAGSLPKCQLDGLLK